MRAQIKAIGGYSAHADQAALINWIGRIAGVKKVFAVQGEEGPAGALASKIKNNLGMAAEVPKVGQVYEI